MFSTKEANKEFKEWITRTKNLCDSDPLMSFLVAYVSLERGLFRLVLTMRVVWEKRKTQEVRSRMKKEGFVQLLRSIGKPKLNGNGKLAKEITNILEKPDKIRVSRDNVVHGSNPPSFQYAEENAEKLWKSLELLADQGVGMGTEKPYYCWMRLPSRPTIKKRGK